MLKKISEMTAADKEEFLEQTKLSLFLEHGVQWPAVEQKIIEDIENTFDDNKFAEMPPDFKPDAIAARKEFGNQKPELVDYLLWQLKFVTKTEYAKW